MRQIYLLKLESSNIYKIGISVNPKKRIKQLQTGSPDRILLVSSYEHKWSSKIESTLHRKYKLNHVGGEWFELNDYNKDIFLNECKKIGRNFTIINEDQF